MAQVRFYNDGYDYFDENLVLFSADKTHSFLLDYIAKDLSRLPMLLESYVAKKINIVTLELTDYVYTESDIKEMEQIMISLHPFYEYEFKDVFINAIGDYFNNLLIRLFYKNISCNNPNDFLYRDERYRTRFMALTSQFLHPKDKHMEFYYSKYRTHLGFSDDPKIAILIDIGASCQEERGFQKELDAQDSIKKMLFWLFDITVPIIGELSTSQRMWLYGNIEKNKQRDISVATKRLSLKPTFLYRDYHLDSPEYDIYHDQMNDYHKIMNLFKPLLDCNIHRDQENVSVEVMESLNKTIDYLNTGATTETFEEYEISSLFQLLYLEIISMTQNGTLIKRCKHCGMYFVVNTRKREYCDRVARGESKPCLEIGRARTYKKNMKEDPILDMYNRAYKTHHARRQKDKMKPEEFCNWCNEAKAKLEKARAGELDISTFEAWLKI